MSLPRRVATLGIAVLVTLAAGIAVAGPAGAHGEGYSDQAVLVLKRPVIRVGGTNTATLSGCKPGTTAQFAIRSWTQPGPGNSLGDGTLYIGTVTVAADGTASLTFTVPRWLTPDSYAVKGVCELPHGYGGWLATRMRIAGRPGHSHGHGPGQAHGPGHSHGRGRAAVDEASSGEAPDEQAVVAAAGIGRSGSDDPTSGAPGAASDEVVAAAVADEADRSPLARTGLDVADLGRLSVVLLAMGGAALLLARKRRLTVDG